MSLRMPHPENGSDQEENFIEGRAAIIGSLKKTAVGINDKMIYEIIIFY